MARCAWCTATTASTATDIEEVYRQVLRSAQRRVVIANAYFFPGYRLLREIRNAARRGVDVRLILQGQPDMLVAKLAARMTYDYLLKSGVQIHEYCERPLHGKVALVDEDWSTVGSSNLDPLSLSHEPGSQCVDPRPRVQPATCSNASKSSSNNHCKAMSADKVPARTGLAHDRGFSGVSLPAALSRHGPAGCRRISRV